jgi:pyruvate dehydrogenase E1 component alpha subunit
MDSKVTTMDDQQRVNLYRQLLRCMLWEQKLLWWMDEGKISGFYHAGRGQEAVPVGACAALRDDDYIMYAHRGVGYMIAKGLPMEKLFGDFLANVEGTTRGLGAGIVHIAWPDLGILGQSGTLGGGFPIAAGAALSARYRGTDQVCVCFFGDGTANRGTFHEAANAAGVWKLPVVWLCENNGYAVSVPVAASTAVEDIADRGAAYGMPGVVVDGQDVEAVHDAVATAVDRARSGDGPTLIEAKTYRFRGHYEGDADVYRRREELEEWRTRDPVTLQGLRLTEQGVLSEDDLEDLRAEVEREVEDAADRALKAPMPGRERIFEDLYA